MKTRGSVRNMENRLASVRTVEEVYEELRAPLKAFVLTVVAECRNAGANNSGWTFDLVTVSRDRTFVLPARIWDNELTSIRRALGEAGASFEEAMIDGMELEVSGQLRMWPASGDIYLKVTGIKPDFRLRGALLFKDHQTLKSLTADFPNHSRLLVDDDSIYEDAKDGLKVERIRKVTVISPEKSQGVEDFKHHLTISQSRFKPEITYRHMSWARETAAETLRSYCDEARRDGHDLVVITRGGGHWRSMRGFQDEGLARAILESPVPVITGIGHRQDVSIADRAAMASFTTPTAAAVAITTQSSGPSASAQKYGMSFKERLGAEQKKVARLDRELSSVKFSLAQSQAELASANAALQQCDADLHASNYALGESQASHISSARKHGHDLLELATRRVRGYTWLLTLATLATAITLLLNSELVASWMTGESDSGIGLWLSIAVVGISAIALSLQYTSLKRIDQKHNKPLKRPPASAREWEIRVMDVKTVRTLRKLRHHLPRD